MISFIAFTGSLALLILEGWLLIGILGVRTFGLRLFLSLPLAALSNTLLLLILTAAHLPLSLPAILGGHLVITALSGVFLCLKEPLLITKTQYGEQINRSKSISAFSIILSTLLLVTLIYSTAHTFLPTFHYDSATNWNMRAKISFVEKELVLTEQHEMIAKPHYPFLYHALEITTQQGQQEWNDRFANVIHLLLSLSALAAFFILIRRLKGKFAALLSVTLITTTPLFAMHMGGSYADIPLVLFALLSLSSLLLFERTQEFTWILLSAIFVSACVWTKSEGLPFCLIPWLMTVAFLWWRKHSHKKHCVKGVLAALALSLPWPLFAFARGVSLSPHGSQDLSIGLQEGATEVASAVIFTGGSPGAILPIALLSTVFVLLKRNETYIDRQYLWGLSWGLLSFIAILFVYLFTSNAVYLINGQSFDRQLLLPTSLLVVVLVLSLFRRSQNDY